MISCVRPHPSALKSAVEGNERSRTNAKYVLPEVEVSDDEGELWADVEDAYDEPKKVEKAKQTGTRQVQKQPAPQRRSAAIATETVTEEHATSACKPVRRAVKAVQVSINPSTEALTQAAALRARRLQRAATDALILPEADIISESDNAEPRSEPDGIPSRSLRSRKTRGSEWLLRRQTTLYELSADESLDELNRSGMETPSRPSQVPAKELLEPSPVPRPAAAVPRPEGSTSMNLTDINDDTVRPDRPAGRVSLGSYTEHWECFNATAEPPADARGQDESSLAKGSYHTAPETTELEPVQAHDPDEDSQTRLLRSQGINVAPRRAWASTNDPAAPSKLADDRDTEQAESGASSNASALRAPLQESATHAGKPTKAKRAKSTGHQQTPQDTETVSRRRSALSESQNAATQMEWLPIDQRRLMGAFRAYTEAETKANDETPFMFRKRASKGSRADSREGTVAAVSTKQRRPMKFLSSRRRPISRCCAAPGIGDAASGRFYWQRQLWQQAQPRPERRAPQRCAAC